MRADSLIINKILRINRFLLHKFYFCVLNYRQWAKYARLIGFKFFKG